MREVGYRVGESVAAVERRECGRSMGGMVAVVYALGTRIDPLAPLLSTLFLPPTLYLDYPPHRYSLVYTI